MHPEGLRGAKRRAAVLQEALPYIQRFWGKTVVIKYGGHAMVDEELRASFARDIVLLKLVGINPVVVHGGGPMIGELLQKLRIQSQFVEGLRVTDQATMDVVEMVLVGKVNKEIVARIQAAGGRCVGLSGKDGGLIRAARTRIEVPREDAAPELIDLGKVGDVSEIDPGVISAVESAGFIAVIAPVGVSESGETLNINADVVAGRVAEALNAEKLILLTDVPGVALDDDWVQSLGDAQVEPLIAAGAVRGGMIPKLRCAAHALANGVDAVHVLDGRVEHTVLLELFTDEGIGTMLTSGEDLVRRPAAVNADT